jgi:hypothetical protein
LAAQVTEQVPDEQTAVPLAPLHTLPQPPQFSREVSMAASQPLAALPSQSAKPVAQVGTQVPAAQAVVPWALVQALPHTPQFSGFALVSASQPLLLSRSQSPLPASHAKSQIPAMHTARVPPSHCRPQTPQWLALLRVSASQPLIGLPSQSP